MGQQSVEDIASIETVLHELLLRMEVLDRVHQQDVAHIRVSLDQWQDITQSLLRLLEVRTQGTAEVSSGYRTLGEHLVRFSQYLVSSEVMLKRAEGPLTCSGFQTALSEVRASGGTVDRRLERIEIWLEIVEDDPSNAPSRP